MGKLARGLLVSFAVAAVVVVAAAAVPLSSDGPPDQTLDTAEFAPDAAVAEPIPASGEVRLAADAAGASGTLLVDTSHDNRVEPRALQPLLSPVVEAGYDVEVHRRGNFTEALDDADALIVADPGDPYGPDELDAIEDFVEDGGRLLILAEPTRVQVSASLFGTSIVPMRSEVTELGSRFDLAFDTEYVYDSQRNDANYKRPLVTPASGASVSPFRGNLTDVGNVSLYTATSVRSVGGGATVLETYETARVSDTDDVGPVPVAVRDGNVLAVGDATFLGADYHRVADNEAFVARLAEFLVGGERRSPGPSVPEPADEGAPTNDSAAGGGNESAADGGNESAKLGPVGWAGPSDA